jgi:ABC-type Mn2+/Zn2+ transport system permease subunit
VANAFSGDSVALWWPAMLAGCLAGLCLGHVGTFVLVKRAVFVGAAVGQVSMVGLAVFLLLQAAPVAAPQAARAAIVETTAQTAATPASPGPGSAADALDALTAEPLAEPVVAPTGAAHTPEGAHGEATWVHEDAHDDSESPWGLVFALLGSMVLAGGLALAPRPKRVTTEAVIGVGYIAAAAVVVIVRDLAPGKAGHIDQLIFGTAATVPKLRVAMLALAALVVLTVHAVFRRRFILCAFDPEFARTLGHDPVRYNVMLFCTFAVAISVATDAIGALPVFGFLVLPPAGALMATQTMNGAIALAPALGVAAAAFGYGLSWELNLPTGAMQVATGLAILGGCAVVGRVRR